ncbi:MAG: glycoside hydrolase [Actinobacteria bacterium]|nr:glycoside hydrolase [Actinomycetota bacterium]
MRFRPTLAVSALGIVLALALAVPAEAVPQSWSAPVDVSTANDSDAPRVVIAPDGSITSVWVETGGGAATIMASTSADDGATWSAPAAISASNLNIRLPEIAVDSVGVRTVVWAGENGGSTVIEGSSSSDGLTWSAPAIISGTDATAPQISIDASDVRYVVWQALPGVYNEVHGSASTDGLTWGAPTLISDSLTESTAPQLEFLPNSDIVVIWSAGNVIQSSLSTDLGATWGLITDLTAAGPAVGQPTLAVSSAGRVAALWYSTDPGGDNIAQTASSADGQTWAGAIDISATGGSAELFDIAFAPDGTIHAIWDRYDLGGNSIVQAAHSSDDGATWSAPLDLSATGQNGSDARLAIDSASQITATWTQDDLVTFPVIQYTTSIDGGATFALAAALSVGGQGAATPRLAVSASDVVTAVWTMFDGVNVFLQSARSQTTPAAAGSAPVLAVTGTPRYATELTILGSALLAAGIIALALQPRRRGAHRA